MDKKLVETVAQVSKVLAGTKTLRNNLSGVLELLAEKVGATRSFIVIYQDETEFFEPIANQGLSISEFRRLETKFAKSSLKKVYETGTAAVISPVNADDSLGFLTQTDPANTLIAVPVQLGNVNLGVLAAEFSTGQMLDSEFLTTFLALVASLIGQTIRIERSVAGERRKLQEENTHLKQELKEKHDFSHIIGNSSPMRQVYDQVTQVARSNTTVLLRGESGTGKEMIANAIHYNSLRSKQPFVKVNCAALPETLIESELFGYEKGAFTGADKRRKGRFEMADGGTLFLDEIGDLPPQTQIKILRVLQEREFERLGGNETVKINVRLITATNKNLEKLIIDGTFREDLFYRLNVFTIFLPPLRERKSDILLLAEHFLEKYEAEHGKRIRRISTPAIDMLTSYHFPGNVRELANAVERAVLVCDSNVIHGHHLPPTLQTAEVSGTQTKLTLASAVEAFERDLIADTLKSSAGNVAKAAKTLDTTERILSYKMKKYAINPRRFKVIK